GTVEQAYAFNCPLRAAAGRAPAHELGVSTTPGVVLESMKKAEDGNGYIVRVYEAHGGRQRAAIELGMAVAAVEAVDLMERPSDAEGPVEIADRSSIRFFIKPYEIRTFRLAFAAQ
ncbi:MAG: glycosyl hydrolase-related protein, partial [Proteobacteria bacterium]|nr:glycosyl hydrolase-related protein [Pseudomonadota bacterium]